MDQSLLNELKELKDAFQRETQRNATEMGRIGSLLDKAIEKATANSNQPVSQAAPSQHISGQSERVIKEECEEVSFLFNLLIFTK